MLKKVAFDPGCEAAQHAVLRLETFHNAAADASRRNFPAAQLNDAAVFFHELSPRSRVVTYEFIARAFEFHRVANEKDANLGLHERGARMIIAAGPRIQVRTGRQRDTAHLASILRRLQSKEISVEQAINEAFRAQPLAGHVPALQANFAFTKAYLVDDAGSKAGFAGANCFVDMSIFDEPAPEWISLDKPIQWETNGMSGKFARIININRDMAARRQHAGIRDAKEIAKALKITALDSAS
ncbi:hypothetical protein [Sorangium cellulosum]|uniref:hypothetical protein n=1 Tax=Sorangium cellulosum TaxID=56 RepID=UPI0011DD8A7B|nr:hypothetical protein [Sorangium cellulosum]